MKINSGSWYAVGAYVLWGLSPIYWKSLRHVPAPQLLSHRILWSFVSLGAAVLLLREVLSFRDAFLRVRVLGIYTIAAILVGINWLLFVWAVNAGFIVQTSLGYFINPLISVLMGVIFLRERLRRWQWGAVGLAGAGMLYLTLGYGSPPWIALTLAFSWATYGLVKKIGPLGSLCGLTLETAILVLPCLIYLAHSEMVGEGAFLHGGMLNDGLLVGTGLLTAAPLFLFASALRRIPLSQVGMLQYVSPSLQFLIAVLIYKEPFSFNQFIGFGLVWIALMIFGIEGFLTYRTANWPEVKEISAYPVDL